MPRSHIRLYSEVPLSARRSSTRGAPRGLFGNNGWITAHSRSVKSQRDSAKKPWFEHYGLVHTISCFLWIHNLGTILDGNPELAARTHRVPHDGHVDNRPGVCLNFNPRSCS